MIFRQWFTLYRRLCVSCAALVFSAGASFASEPKADSLTLYQLLESIEAHHPQILSLKAQLRGTREGVNEVAAAYRPQLILEGRVQTSSRFATFQDGDQFSQSETPRDLSISLRQSVYNGGHRRLQTYGAQLRVKYAQANLQENLAQIKVATLSDYVALCSVQDRIRILKDGTGLLSSLLVAAEERYRLGEGSIIDVAHVKTRLASAEGDFVQAQGQRLLLLTRLEFATGVRLVTAELPAAARQPLSVELNDLLVRTRQTHPRAKAQNLNIQIQRADFAAQSRTKRAKVTFAASVNRAENYSPTIDQNDQASVGIELSLPIYSGGQYKSGLRRSRANVRAAELTLTDTFRTLDLMIQQLWQEVSTLEQIRVSSSEALDASLNARLGVIAAEKAGFASMTDVLDATQSTLSARLALSQAEHQLAENRLLLLLHADYFKGSPAISLPLHFKQGE